MSKELEAFMKYCPIIPSENNFKYWSDYQIALKKYERELQTFTKTFELLKKALTELEELKRYPTVEEVALIPEANIKLVTCELQLRELKCDVKRYFELEGNYQKSSHEYHEMEYIKNKLLEVGNEDV